MVRMEISILCWMLASSRSNFSGMKLNHLLRTVFSSATFVVSSWSLTDPITLPKALLALSLKAR